MMLILFRRTLNIQLYSIKSRMLHFISGVTIRLFSKLRKSRNSDHRLPSLLWVD